jgi:hypothetical protein
MSEGNPELLQPEKRITPIDNKKIKNKSKTLFVPKNNLEFFVPENNLDFKNENTFKKTHLKKTKKSIKKIILH